MVGLGPRGSQAVNYNEKLPGEVTVGPGARPKKEVIAAPPILTELRSLKVREQIPPVRHLVFGHRTKHTRGN